MLRVQQAAAAQERLRMQQQLQFQRYQKRVALQQRFHEQLLVIVKQQEEEVCQSHQRVHAMCNLSGRLLAGY